VVLAGGPLRARSAWGQIPSGVGRWLILRVAVSRLPAGFPARLGLAVAVGAVLAAVDPGDGLAGVLPGSPLGRLARHLAERLLGVGDPIGAAVVLNRRGGLPPRSPPPGGGGQRAELSPKVAGLVLLQCEAAGAALPG